MHLFGASWRLPSACLLKSPSLRADRNTTPPGHVPACSLRRGGPLSLLATAWCHSACALCPAVPCCGPAGRGNGSLLRAAQCLIDHAPLGRNGNAGAQHHSREGQDGYVNRDCRMHALASSRNPNHMGAAQNRMLPMPVHLCSIPAALEQGPAISALRWWPVVIAPGHLAARLSCQCIRNPIYLGIRPRRWDCTPPHTHTHTRRLWQTPVQGCASVHGRGSWPGSRPARPGPCCGPVQTGPLVALPPLPARGRGVQVE